MSFKKMTSAGIEHHSSEMQIEQFEVNLFMNYMFQKFREK